MNKARDWFVVLLLAIKCGNIGAQEALPVVNVFQTGFFNVGEPRGVGEFTVVKDLKTALSVQLEFTGTAIRGIDYITTNSVATNVLFMSATNASRAISISLIDDLRPETNETVIIRILPSASYTIGPYSTATMVLGDNDPLTGTNRLPSNSWSPLPPQTIAFGTNLSLTVASYDLDGDVVSVEFFNGANSIGRVTQLNPGTTNRFTLIWTNLPMGAYDVFARATDNRGGFTDSLHAKIVAADFVYPSASGSILPGGGLSPQVLNWFDPQGRTNAAIAEFAVPAVATNREGFLRVLIQGAGASYDARTDVYLYEGDGKLSESDLIAPLTYVTSIPANALNGTIKFIDLTPWLPQFAGKVLGIQFRTDRRSEIAGPTGEYCYGYQDISLALLAPETYDAPTRIEFPDVALDGWLVRTNPMRVSIDLSDPDNFPASWLLEADANIQASGEFPALSSGVVHLSVPWTNVTLGAHTLLFSVKDANGNITSKQARYVVVVGTDEPPSQISHLGMTGGSGSFYVIDAAGRAHVWGRNDKAQLGLNFRAASTITDPRVPTTLMPPNGLDFRQIAAGPNHAFGLMSDGSLYTWGSNSDGLVQSANPAVVRINPTRYNSPPQVLLIRKVASTDHNGFFLDQDGHVWRWGAAPFSSGQMDGVWDDFAVSNYRRLFLRNGQLFTSGAALVPFPAGVTAWISFTVADNFSLAIGNDGQLYGWGNNDSGQLPLPTAENITIPTKATPVPGVDGWKRVLASPRLSLAIDSKGRLFAWGSQFVANSNPIANLPTLVQFPKGAVVCVDMSVTTQTAMALSEQGDLFAWGHADQGVWQDFSATDAYYPEPAPGMQNILTPGATPILANFLIDPLSFGNFGYAQTIGARGVPIQVQTSPDLLHWTTLDTFSNTSGFEYIVVPNNLPHSDSLFLRIKAAPVQIR